jgi:hypothetical protein
VACYAIAAAIAAIGAWAHFNPASGAVARRWPWDFERPLSWSPLLAQQAFFLLLFASCVVAALSRAGPRRGAVAAIAAALSLGALATLARGEAPASGFLYGLETYVAGVLALAAAAGLLAASRGGPGRGLAALTGLALLLVLFYPVTTPEEAAKGETRAYHAAIPDLVNEVASRTGRTPQGVDPETSEGGYWKTATAGEVLLTPWAVGAILSLAIAACAVLSWRLGARRALAWTAVVAFLGLALYPTAWQAIRLLGAEPGTLPEEHGSTGPVESAFLATGLQTRITYAPFLLAFFAAALDLLRPRAPARPAP